MKVMKNVIISAPYMHLEKDKIQKKLNNNVGEKDILNIINNIKLLMIQNKISIGDDNINNYMCKNDKWYRIDFTKSYFAKSLNSLAKVDKYLKFNKKFLWCLN